MNDRPLGLQRARAILIATGVVAGVGALVMGMIALERATRPADSPTNPAKPRTEYEARLKGVPAIIIRDDHDERIWEFQAREISVSADRNLTEITGLRKGIYYRNDKPSMTFTADRVRYDATTKRLELEGNVSADDVRGISLNSPRVVWEPKERKFVCARDVSGEVEGLKFSTTELFLWPDKERVECPNEVTAANDRIDLRGRKLTGDLKSDLLTLSRVTASVKVRRAVPREGLPPGQVPPLDPTLFRRGA